MINIKDKGNRSQIFIPRQGEVIAEYVTTADLEKFEAQLKLDLALNYATKDYVNEIIGTVNNALSNLLK